MSFKVSIKQLQDRLPEVLDRVAQGNEEYVVERDGKDCAVLVSIKNWRRRDVARRLDALGASYRFPRAKQARMEALLAARGQRTLTPAERREFSHLQRECDEILARRAEALKQVL